jgi:major membrane immunogen (membrane-anchored lipoprotein)
MRFYSSILILALSLLLAACADREPSSPKETFKTYTKAIATKDTTTMKLLLSVETIKMHENEAKAQNVALDEIVRRETLFTEGQKKVEYKDEKINGDKATLEVKDAFGNWQTLPFVFEDDQWKIDKKNYVEKLGFDIEQQNNQALDDVINQGRIP